MDGELGHGALRALVRAQGKPVNWLRSSQPVQSTETDQITGCARLLLQVVDVVRTLEESRRPDADPVYRRNSAIASRRGRVLETIVPELVVRKRVSGIHPGRPLQRIDGLVLQPPAVLVLVGDPQLRPHRREGSDPAQRSLEVAMAPSRSPACCRRRPLRPRCRARFGSSRRPCERPHRFLEAVLDHQVQAEVLLRVGAPVALLDRSSGERLDGVPHLLPALVDQAQVVERVGIVGARSRRPSSSDRRPRPVLASGQGASEVVERFGLPVVSATACGAAAPLPRTRRARPATAEPAR